MLILTNIKHSLKIGDFLKLFQRGNKIINVSSKITKHMFKYYVLAFLDEIF